MNKIIGYFSSHIDHLQVRRFVLRQVTVVLFLLPVFPLAAQDRAAVNGAVTDSTGALLLVKDAGAVT